MADRNDLETLEAALAICSSGESPWDNVAAAALRVIVADRRKLLAERQEPVYHARPKPRPEAEPKPRPEAEPKPRAAARPQRQGRLLPPAVAGPWNMLFRCYDEFVTGEQIAAALNMKRSTFYSRYEQAGFPPPQFMGRRGRGYSHTWLTRDVLTYLNHYSNQEMIPPILPERPRRDGRRRRSGR